LARPDGRATNARRKGQVPHGAHWSLPAGAYAPSVQPLRPLPAGCTPRRTPHAALSPSLFTTTTITIHHHYQVLAYLHGKGVVHRSLGPSSLFLSTNQQDEAERLTVRLVDLGFAASASTLPQEEVENAMRRGASSPLSVLPMLALNDLHGLGYILLELFLSSAAAQVSTRVGTRQVSKKESVARHASHATRLRSSGPPPLLTYSLLLPHRGAGRARCGHGAHHGTAIPKAAGRGHLRGRRVRGLPRVPTHVESQAGAADQRGLASLG